MEKTIHSVKFLRRRRFLTVLPLLVVPFITMAFWTLGGGKGASGNARHLAINGLNAELPNASFRKDVSFDKLSFYDKADKDSLALLDAISSDPYYKKYITTDTGKAEETWAEKSTDLKFRHSGLNASPDHDNFYEDPNEVKVNRKLEQLRKAINTTRNAPAGLSSERKLPSRENSEFSSQIDRLETMMKAISEESPADAETARLESVMDKLLDIQHPERVKQKLQSKVNNENLFKLQSGIHSNKVSLLAPSGSKKYEMQTGGFYGLTDCAVVPGDQGNSIRVVVHGTQTLINGGIIKLRLIESASVNNTVIPAGNFIYGAVSLGNERLKVDINTIRSGHSLYPVKLSAYDLDGMEGIYVPGVTGSELLNEATDNTMRSIGTMSPDPSLGEQAATAGLNAAKTVFTKKTRLVKVTIKAGYMLLLKN